MKDTVPFTAINPAYNQVFKSGRLSIGLVVPIENYPNDAVPTMAHHIERVQMAEELGFSAIWLRDVPFNVPSFGDAGQLFDPFVYLGSLATQTSRIALGVASIILPLRHPAHVAKAAATADVLSNGRLLLGIASGDRPEEFPALNYPYDERGQLFRENYDYIRGMSEYAPQFSNAYGQTGYGMDMLPKPVAGKLPLLITGFSQQSIDWIAANADGWMTYPRPLVQQQLFINGFRDQLKATDSPDKPVMEPLYIDLAPDPDSPPRAIHLGMQIGINPLRAYLASRRDIGVNHVALNLRFNQADTQTTLEKLAKELIPEFIE